LRYVVGFVRDYFDGKVTSAEALASISRRFEIARARSACSDPAKREDSVGFYRGPPQDATTSTPTSAQQGVVRRLESLREDITSLRDRADRALSGGAFAYSADPTNAFMGLMKLRKDSAALLAYLDQMASVITSLSVPQAIEEELWFQAEVLRIVKQLKELDPAVWRERPAPRPSLPNQQAPYPASAPHRRRYNPYRPAAWQDVSDLKIFLGVLLVTVVVPFVFISCIVLGSAD
jgi:hypothetical protein